MTPLSNSPSAGLHWFKLWYFFYFSAQFTQLYLPLILSEVMIFSPATIGLLMSVRRLVLFFVAPLFTWACDSTLLHRYMVLATHTCYYFCTFLLTHFRTLQTVLPIILFREAFISGCEPTIDNAALAKIEDSDGTAVGYGQLRMYGSAGWGLASLFGSLIVDYLFHGNLIMILYIQLFIGLVVVSIVTFGLDLSTELFNRQNERKKESGLVLHLVLAAPRARFCAVCVLAQGIVYGLLQMTLFLYIKPLGVTTSILGLSELLSCGSEAMVFCFDRELRRQLGGSQGAFSFGLVISSLSLFCYALIPLTGHPAPLFLLIEIVNGATYALVFTSALAIANELAPPNLTTTAQGTLSAVYSGIGPAIGAAISGWGYQTFGAPALYCTIAVSQLLVISYPLLLGIDISQDALLPPASIRERGEDEIFGGRERS